MPSLKVWNVGHGEAMRIDIPDDQVSVIRDFGQMKSTRSKSKHQKIENIQRQLLEEEEVQVETDSILSHAHYDHFNGFKHLYDELALRGKTTKLFRNSYIPWLDFKTAESLGYTICRVTTYLYVYHGANPEKAKQYKNWFLAAPIMYALSHSLCGVSAGYKLPWGNAKVLWPPPPLDKYYSTDLASIGDRLNEVFRLIDDLVSVENIETMANKLGQLLSQYHPVIPNNSESVLGQRISVDENGQRIKEMNDVFDQLKTVPLKEKRRLPTQISSICRIASGRLDQSIDDHSLVVEFPNQALFLSDLSSNCMDMMALKYMAKENNYKILKSAHHGTRIGSNIFTRRLSTIKTLIHCCGSSSKAFHAPSCKYCDLPTKDKDGVIWTDTHENKRRCCSAKAFTNPIETFSF